MSFPSPSVHGGRFGGGALLSTLTFFNSATSITASITIPASAPAGAIAFLFDLASNSVGEPAKVNPNNNWTELYDKNFFSTTHRLVIWYRILDADDEGDSITGMDGTSSDTKVMLVFTGDAGIASAAAFDIASEGTSGNPAGQTCNASGGVVPLIVFGLASIGSGTAAFSTASPAFDATVATSNADLLVGYKIYNSSPQDHSIDMNDLGAVNILASLYVQAT